MPLRLMDLSDDVLIHLCTFLDVPDILKARQTCKRFNTLLHLAIIWINACEEHILRNGYPFPHPMPLSSPEKVNSARLEIFTKRAWRLAARWKTSTLLLPPRMQKHLTVSPSTPISDVRFIPGEERFLLTVSKGIWSVLTVWDLSEPHEGNGDSEEGPRKRSSWSPKGGIFTGLAVDASCAALSVAYDSVHQVHLFHINDQGELLLLRTSTLARPMKPLILAGSFLALCDDMATTVIWNWSTGSYAILEHKQDEEGVWKQDHPIQVVFAYESILVVRARSMHLFPKPNSIELEMDSTSLKTGFNSLSEESRLGVTEDTGTSPASLTTEKEPESLSVSATEAEELDLDLASSPRIYSPLVKHTFGWVDGVSVSVSGSAHSPLRILVRAESDNPWVDVNEHKLDLYVLEPDPSYCFPPSPSSPSLPGSVEPDTNVCTTKIPYLFPPKPHPYLSVPSTHGSLRCPSVHLGPCGTGVWVRPGSAFSSGTLGRNTGRYEVNNGLGLVDPRLWAEFSSFSDANSQLAFAAGLGSAGAGHEPALTTLGLSGEGEGRVYETLVAAVFPGPLNSFDSLERSQTSISSQSDPNPKGTPVRVVTLATNTSSTNSWTALDYDEARGRVGVGCADGCVWVFEL